MTLSRIRSTCINKPGPAPTTSARWMFPPTNCFSRHGMQMARLLTTFTLGNAPLLRLDVVPDIASPGNRVFVNAHADPIPYNYDAWAIVIFPNGQMQTMAPGKGLRRGAFPIVKNAAGIASPLDVTLLSTTIPAGVRTGTYTVAIGLFPHDTSPISLADASLKAFPGCFQQIPITVNQ